MKELSIFIDESGDFGNYNFHSPYYILSLVFHNQNNDIDAQILHLNQKLSYYNIEDKSIHTAPLVRGEETIKILMSTIEEKFFYLLFLLLKDVIFSINVLL